MLSYLRFGVLITKKICYVFLTTLLITVPIPYSCNCISRFFFYLPSTVSSPIRVIIHVLMFLYPPPLPFPQRNNPSYDHLIFPCLISPALSLQSSSFFQTTLLNITVAAVSFSFATLSSQQQPILLLITCFIQSHTISQFSALDFLIIKPSYLSCSLISPLFSFNILLVYSNSQRFIIPSSSVSLNFLLNRIFLLSALPPGLRKSQLR